MRMRVSLLDKFQILVVLVLFGFKLIPQFQYRYTGTFWSIAYQVIFFGWMLLTVFKSGFWFRFLSSYLKQWGFWIIYLLFAFMIFPNTQLGFLSLNLTFWEPMLIYYYYSKIVDNPKMSRIIACFCILFLLYGLFQSIQSVNVNELAAREASSGHSSEDAALTGNYSFTAALSILLPISFLYIQSKMNILWKVVAILFVALTSLFIFKCNLMISILCMLITIPLYVVFGKRKKLDGKRVILFGFMVFLFFICFTYLKPILIFAIETMGTLIGSDEITKKVVQITSLINGSMVGNVASRFHLDLIAINTFLHNPVIGIGPQNNANIYFLNSLGFHATFFDDLARYGVIGMTIMISVYVSFFRDLFTIIDDSLSIKAVKASLLTYIIISLLNPTISANVGIVLFFIIPTLAKMVFECENKEMER